MKVIHVTHNDGMGGASIAAYRQHEGYLAKGIDSYFFVKESSGRVDNTIESASTNCSLTFKQKLYEDIYLKDIRNLKIQIMEPTHIYFMASEQSIAVFIMNSRSLIS